MVVGLTPEGGIDKTILEGMAAGCLVLTSNSANKEYGVRTFNYGDPDDLADQIMALNDLSLEEKEKESREMVKSVIEHHSVHKTVKKISDIFKND